MIIIMRNRAPQDQIEAVVDKVKQLGFRPHISAGEETTIIGVIGDAGHRGDARRKPGGPDPEGRVTCTGR